MIGIGATLALPSRCGVDRRRCGPVRRPETIIVGIDWGVATWVAASKAVGGEVVIRKRAEEAIPPNHYLWGN